jgi:hypothetical protein
LTATSRAWTGTLSTVSIVATSGTCWVATLTLVESGVAVVSLVGQLPWLMDRPLLAVAPCWEGG